jgi:hypothetical protein
MELSLVKAKLVGRSQAKGWWIVFRQTSRGHDKPDFDHKTAWVRFVASKEFKS